MMRNLRALAMPTMFCQTRIQEHNTIGLKKTSKVQEIEPIANNNKNNNNIKSINTEITKIEEDQIGKEKEITAEIIMAKTKPVETFTIGKQTSTLELHAKKTNRDQINTNLALNSMEIGVQVQTIGKMHNRLMKVTESGKKIAKEEDNQDLIDMAKQLKKKNKEAGIPKRNNKHMREPISKINMKISLMMADIKSNIRPQTQMILSILIPALPSINLSSLESIRRRSQKHMTNINPLKIAFSMRTIEVSKSGGSSFTQKMAK